MKFLADMGIAAATATHLRSLGHAAVHLRELGLQRLEDEAIVRMAEAEARIILTHDLDFGRIVALSGARVPSVVTFRLNDMRPASVNGALAATLARFSIELEAGALISVSDSGIRVRLLPIKPAPQADSE
jgi:predicted nuclease of predicted toxin-antitoxin system